VLVEAMGFGVPVVSTNCRSGPDEILEHGKYGRLVDVGNHQQLAAAILEELQNPNRDKIELFLKERSNAYTYQTSVEAYFNLIMGT